MTKELKGRKTYIVAFIMALYAVSGMVLHKLSLNDGFELLMQAGAFVGLRMGIAKK